MWLTAIMCVCELWGNANHSHTKKYLQIELQTLGRWNGAFCAYEFVDQPILWNWISDQPMDNVYFPLGEAEGWIERKIGLGRIEKGTLILFSFAFVAEFML